jgi:hypothetical protein
VALRQKNVFDRRLRLPGQIVCAPEERADWQRQDAGAEANQDGGGDIHRAEPSLRIFGRRFAQHRQQHRADSDAYDQTDDATNGQPSLSEERPHVRDKRGATSSASLFHVFGHGPSVRAREPAALRVPGETVEHIGRPPEHVQPHCRDRGQVAHTQEKPKQAPHVKANKQSGS